MRVYVGEGRLGAHGVLWSYRIGRANDHCVSTFLARWGRGTEVRKSVPAIVSSRTDLYLGTLSYKRRVNRYETAECQNVDVP